MKVILLGEKASSKQKFWSGEVQKIKDSAKCSDPLGKWRNKIGIFSLIKVWFMSCFLLTAVEQEEEKKDLTCKGENSFGNCLQVHGV